MRPRALAIEDGLGGTRALMVRKPRRLCAPTLPTEGGLEAGGGYLLCYDAARRSALCAADAPMNAGGACASESACGGLPGLTTYCVPASDATPARGLRIVNSIERMGLQVTHLAEVCVPAAVATHPELRDPRVCSERQ